MRGKPISTSSSLYSIGITPADAGKTTARFNRSLATEDHPRGCGENSFTFPPSNSASGSPPRMRGKLNKQLVEEQNKGITPADAGKTR